MARGLERDLVTCSADPLHTTYVRSQQRCVLTNDDVAKAELLRRHLQTLSRGPRAQSGDDCRNMVGILQTYNTCWFNAMCNAFVFSDIGNKLCRGLYVDWVLGIRSQSEVRRILDWFRVMVDLSTTRGSAYVDTFPIKTERLIAKLHRLNPDMFSNVGRQHGWSIHSSYIKYLLRLLGVPLPRIMNVVVKEDTGVVERKLIRRAKRPTVILVHMSHRRKSKAAQPAPDLSGHGYALDACTILSLPRDQRKASVGHIVAGVTCASKRLLFDSLPAENDHGGRQRDDGRVYPYDWANSDRDVQTAVSGEVFNGTRSSRVLIYYERTHVDRVYSRSVAIANAWLALHDRGETASPELQRKWKTGIQQAFKHPSSAPKPRAA